MNQPIRQGDVYLVPVDAIPAKITPVARDAGRIILAYGEGTGRVPRGHRSGVDGRDERPPGHRLTMRLDKLTPDQEALLPVIRDEWLAVGLSTERADRARAEAGVRAAYAAAKLPPPAIVVWLESPLPGGVGAEYLPLLLG